MSDEKVVKFYPANASDNPDMVLEQAAGEFNDVLVIGWDKDDELDARCSSGISRKAETVYLLQTFLHKLLNGDYDNVE